MVAPDFGLLFTEDGKVQTSQTGLVKVLGSGVGLTAFPTSVQRLASPALSIADGETPAWVAALIDVDVVLNWVTFDATLTGDTPTDADLGVYWDGTLIATIDERYALTGTQSYGYPLPGTYNTGSFTLAFRLDAYGPTESSVRIDNVLLSRAEVAVPEPKVSYVAGVMALANLPRRRKRHLRGR
jgi:hypothetical protein